MKTTSYDENSNICYEYYLDEEGLLHREDGPAWIEYDPAGDLYLEMYLINGDCHREDGPAVIYYYEEGNNYNYFLNGIKYEEPWQTENWIDFAKYYKKIEIFI